MKKLIKTTIFVFLLYPIICKAQCNIKTNNSEGIVFGETSVEKLYTNIDLENGYNMYYSKMYFSIDKNNVRKNYLLVDYAKSYNYRKEIKPREIVIHFQDPFGDDNSISLSAETETTLDSKTPIIYEYKYILNENELQKIKSLPVNSIVIVDRKTNLSLNIKAIYEYTFYEAEYCIDDWLKKNN